MISAGSSYTDNHMKLSQIACEHSKGVSGCIQKRVGLYGGSFDPVHNGHLAAARESIKTAQLDEVWFVPAYISPFKRDYVQTSAEHRIAMLNLAIEGESQFRISTADLERGGVSYTIDTIRNFNAEYPEIEFLFIIGADSLATLQDWHDSKNLLKICRFIVLARPGWNLNRELRNFTGEERQMLTRWIVYDFNKDISSSEIRSLIASGKSTDKMLPEPVSAYIAEHGLYRNQEPG